MTNANTVPSVAYLSNSINVNLSPGQSNYSQVNPFANVLSPNKALSFPDSLGTIVEGPRTVSYAANTLGSTTHTYTSPLQDDIINLANYFADWGFSYTIEEGPIYKMTVVTPFDDITNEDFNVSEFSTEQWEITPVAGSKNLIYSGLLSNPFSPPTVTNNYTVLPLPLQSAVQLAAKNGAQYLNITGSLTTAQQILYAPYIPIANQILMYLKIGIEGIPQYTQTLKRTAVIDVANTNNAFNTAADEVQKSLGSQGTINYLLATSDMTSNYPIPSTVIDFMLPSYSKILGVINIDPIQYVVYAGWLVKPASIQFLGRNKISLQQEFVWDEWAASLYYIKSAEEKFPLIITGQGA